MQRMRMCKQMMAMLLALVMCIGMVPASALAAELGEDTGPIPAEESQPQEALDGSEAPEADTSGITFNVLDYGADPTGTRESSTAVQRALAAAKEVDPATPKTIYFPKGEYHFYAGYSEVRRIYASNTLSWNEAYGLGYQDKYIGILVEDMENVTIDGGGSKLIFHGNICAMAAINSKNVTFTNFEQDHASPSVVEMLVESVDTADDSAIVYIPPCYDYEVNGTSITWVAEPDSPEETEPYWRLGGPNSESVSNVTFDALSGAPSGGNKPWDNVTAIEKIDATHLKITYSDESKLPDAGTRHQRRNTAPRMTPGVFVTECENVTFRDATYRFLHGFGMLLQVTKDVTYDNVTIGGNTEMGRDSGGFADFIHGSTVAGTVTIKNCDFDGAQDDAINIHGTYLQVTDISEDRKTLEVRYMHAEAWGFPQYHVGDVVDFTSQTDMTPVEDSTRTVVALCDPGEGTNMDGTPRSQDNEEDMRTIIVTLDEPIPEEITVDPENNYGYVMENVTYTPTVIVENNRFVNINACGLLVTTRRPIKIVNNYFDRTSNASIYIAGAAHGYNESGRVEDLLIQGNTFVANPSSSHFKAQGTIRVQPEDGRGVTPDPPTAIYKNVRILDNDFLLMNSVYAVNIDNVDGLTVENNRFLRYDPAIQLDLTVSGDGTVPIGGTVTATLEQSAKEIGKKLFRLETCENVTIANNTYDNGLNLGVDFSGGTTADDVTLTGDGLDLGGDNKLPAVGTVSYVSSDPTVAAVSANGEVTGVDAGTAEICAYTVAGGRTFTSAPVTVTVEGSSGGEVTDLHITGADTIELGAEATYTAATSSEDVDVIWTVKPVSEGASAVMAQDGTLTAAAPGLVEITATAGGMSASKFVTISGAMLSDAWEIAGGETEGGWKLGSTVYTVSVDALACNSDWLTTNDGKNMIVTDVEGDFEASVKLIDGACEVDECYEEAGLVVYQDADHYVLVGRKNRSKRDTDAPWLALVKETSSSSAEVNHISDPNKDGAIYLKVKKEGNTFTAYYSLDGAEWTQLDGNHGASYDVPLTNYRVGVYAYGGSKNGTVMHEPKFYEFADFTLKEDGEEASTIAFASSNQAPIAGEAELTAGDGEVTLDYTFTDPEGDEDTDSVIAWYVADSADGVYSRIEDAAGSALAITAETSGKWVKAVVAPADAEGHFGAPVVSDAIQAPAQENDPTNADLSALSAGGVALSPAFDPEVTEYTADLPGDVDTVTVTARPAQAAATVTGAGMVTLEQDVTDHVVTVANGEMAKEYTITFRRFKSGDSALSSLTASAGEDQIAFDEETRYYHLDGGTAGTMTFAAQTADPGATIKVRFNDRELGDYTEAMTLPLEYKLNVLELHVVPASGHSLTIYRVVVLRDISSDAALQSLKADGKEIAIGESLDLGRVIVGETVTLEAAASDSAAAVFIDVDGKTVENGTPFSLTGTRATAEIRVVAENGATDNVYTLELVKQDADDAALYSLDLGGISLVHDGETGFDPDVTEYTAVDHGSKTATLHAVAVQENAKVSYETVAEYAAGTGAVTGPCSFFGDVGVPEDGGDPVNTVTVTVTSPNGQTTRTYTIRVICKNEIWLSDLDWGPGSTTGWANHETQKDYEISGAPTKMTLIDPETNEVVTFDKGLGAHANCETIYDISGMGITKFTAKVGLDHSQASNPDSNVKGQTLTFDVIVDGEKIGTATGLAVDTPYQVLECTIPENAQTLTLKVTYSKNVAAGAHADWADAKLYSDFSRVADTEIPVQYLSLAVSDLVLSSDEHETFDLADGLTIKPSGATNTELTWASSDDEVATVDENGLVTAVSDGTAAITVAASNGLTSTCAVTVGAGGPGEIPVESIALNDDAMTLAPDETSQLTATVLPEDATDKEIAWSSSNDAVATVDRNGLVTAVSEGTATITATASNGLTAACTVTVARETSGGSSSGSSARYTIRAEAGEGGTIAPSGNVRVTRGSDRTFTIRADEGYQIQSVVVDGKNVGAVATYTFEDVRSGHTIEASFTTDLNDGDVPAGDVPADGLPFLDVPADAWYQEAVAYAADKGLMNGVSATQFAPDALLTRAMAAQILHRAAGEPVSAANAFDDVAADQWYAAAVNWAAEAGIVSGYGDGRFGPDDNVTREQLAVILYNFAKRQNMDVAAGGGLSAFADAASVSDWAEEAMIWAVGKGLISGKEGSILDPAGSATRAEVATILMRFCEIVAK